MKTSAFFIIAILLALASQQADSMKLTVEIMPKLAPPAESEVSPGKIGENIGICVTNDSIYQLLYFVILQPQQGHPGL